jgi:hypothetical protein
MTRVVITDDAMRAIRAAATHGFAQTGVRCAGGWRVPFHPDTLERIHDHAMPGETVSDVIVRVCSIAASAGRRQ